MKVGLFVAKASCYAQAKEGRNRMTDVFDDFANRHWEKKQQLERLQTDTPAEWFAVKSFAEDLAKNGKGIEGYQFEWVADDYAPRLVLGAVAAIFLQREKGGKVDRRVQFDRKPLGPNQEWVVEKSPFQVVEWSLVPMINGDNIGWMIAEVNAELNKQVKFSSSDLAGRIGIRLAEFLLAYNKHYEKWSAV